MFEEQSADMVFLFPIKLMKRQSQFALQPCRPLVAQAVSDPARAAVEIINLAAWSFQVAVMKKPLQPPQHLLPAAGAQRNDMVRTKESVTEEAFQNLTVTVGQP